jgi:4-diphosphocytidyl-2-C-methyl-D-erythritol kinase
MPTESQSRKPLLIAEAPAKINLGLHILRKRQDGFHDLESVFLRIGWSDTLSAELADGLSLTCTDPSVPTDDENLVLRAAHCLRDSAGSHSGARLHLDKHIPSGAGLGGGSSDAASTLMLLEGLWNLDVKPDELARIGASIGSDVPFFLGGKAALVRGRGEIIEPLPQYDFPFSLVVVKPEISVPTREAYQQVVPRSIDRLALKEVVTSNDPDRWRRELVNDFEVSVFATYPGLSQLKAALYRSGALYASLSGSGSAVFGVYEKPGQAEAAAHCLRKPHWKIWWGGT